MNSLRAWGVLLCVLGLACAAAAQPCSLTYGTTFNTGELNGAVNTIGVGNAGAGIEALVGGEFAYAGGTRAGGIAAWNGVSWRTFGEGFDAPVKAVAVFDDGNGPEVYAAGSFVHAGSTVVNHIARWNGVAWVGLAGGVDGAVNALRVHDDGSGPALYVGGQFNAPAGSTGKHLARWRAGGWSSVGGGSDFAVLALTTHNEGPGAALYAGGWFTMIGGQPASHIAKWDGAAWSPLGSGTNNAVHALMSASQAGVPVLFAGGRFNTAGGVTAVGVARWVSHAWSAAANATGNGANNHVDAFAVFEGEVYAGGKFTAFGSVPASGLAVWNGSQWTGVPGGAPAAVRGMATLPGSAPMMLIGGLWGQSTYEYSRNIQGFRSGGWWRIAAPTTSLPGAALGGTEAMLIFDAGSGPQLFAGGSFSSLGLSPGWGVKRWTGAEWEAVGDLGYGVADLAVYDDGAGPHLYACGEFVSGPFNEPVRGIARWNGTAWERPGNGTVIYGYALAVHDEDGAGPGRPALFLGGIFESVAGVSARGIARWDGQTWTAVGDGITNGIGVTQGGFVHTLAVHDEGSGPALYAGGIFDHAGGVEVRNVARWDGANWSAVGQLFMNYSASVQVLRSFNDGSGSALYAGGSLLESTFPFNTANIQRWRSGHWETVGNGLTGGSGRGVAALEVFDDGTGPALIAGGDFAYTLQKLTPSGWASVFPPLEFSNVYQGGVHALRSVDLGQGPVLVAGGGLQGIALPNALLSSNIVELRGCYCYANCDRSAAAPILNVADFICFMNRYATGDPWANCDGSTSQPTLNVADFICFGNKFAAGCP